MQIAVMWSRFGPYHLARLRAAAALGKENGAEIVGVEVAETDRQYAWDICPNGQEYIRRTVFPGMNYHALSGAQIRNGVQTALDELDPDAIAINGWSVTEARAALNWSKRRPNVGVIVMSETKEDDSNRVAWKEMLKRRLLRSADAGLVGGRKQKEYLVKLGMDPGRIFIGYDVVDNDYFAKGARQTRAGADALRRQLRLPEKYFLVCTRFLPRKNVDGLLRAYALYGSRAEQPWNLVIAGSGDEEPTLRQLERTLQLNGVTWSGFIQYEQLPTYYGLASAFIHPAKSEPWGLVVNEAIASGLPVLVSRSVGAGHELVAHGDNGILFDPFDVEDMAAALLRVSRQAPASLAEMALRSAQIADQWRPQRFGKGLIDAAKAAAARTPRSGGMIGTKYAT